VSDETTESKAAGGHLTREALDRTFEAIKNQKPDSPYNHPHHPKCACVASQNLRDCNCGTRGWLISIGFGSYVL